VSTLQTFPNSYCPKDPYGCGQGLSMTALCADQSRIAEFETPALFEVHFGDQLGVIWAPFGARRCSMPSILVARGL
jgi:hypothetical protein